MVNIRKHQVASFRPVNAKILDFTASGTGVKVCSLAGIVSPNAVAIVIGANRQSGSGTFVLYPCNGAGSIQMNTNSETLLCGFEEGNQLLKFKAGTANDDWDIFCYGEILEGPAGS